MSPPALADYLAARARFAVTRELAQQALRDAQPLALDALGIHAQRHMLMEGELPAHIVMTSPTTNGGWGELMPVWFKPYERPVPLHCLDNWALFALLYRSAFGPDAATSAFTIETLARVVIGADLLIPFLPGTDGAGRFLRHGAMSMLLSILWLEPEARAAWLKMHARGAQLLAEADLPDTSPGLETWLEQVETEAFLVPERGAVAGEDSVGAFLADTSRFQPYQRLFGGLCLAVTALAVALGDDWRRWVFQAVNVGYRTAAFGTREIAEWLAHPQHSSYLLTDR